MAVCASLTFFAVASPIPRDGEHTLLGDVAILDVGTTITTAVSWLSDVVDDPSGYTEHNITLPDDTSVPEEYRGQTVTLLLSQPPVGLGPPRPAPTITVTFPPGGDPTVTVTYPGIQTIP